MLKKALTRHLVLATACWVFIFSNCTEPNNVGLQVQPQDDQINVFVTDTITIMPGVELVDSLPISTSSSNLPVGLLVGSYTDDVFGLANAKAYTQLRLSSSGFTYGANADLDSVVLTMAYGGYYGDTTTMQTVNVLRLEDDLEADTTYYTNHVFTEGQSMGAFTTSFNPTDSIIVGSDTLAPHFSMKLLDWVGDELINFSRTTDRTNEELLAVFKGICINTDDVLMDGSIITFNANSSLSKLTVYYNDTSSYEYIIDGNSIRTNVFEHDYTGSDIALQLMDSTLGEQQNYVQSMSGVKTTIEFPHLSSLENLGNIAVNLAELTIPVKSGTFDDLDPNNAIILLASDSIGQETTIVDLVSEINLNYGGFYDDEKEEYKINFTRHFQRLLTGQAQNFGMFLVANNATLTPNRVVLEGAGDTTATSRIKLRLNYSILD
ncbi:MAG: DUF4270 family protein [Bacteroidia bacterium]|nr:DUF4270 domain-containing protein [Bacteroidia bacterium]NNC84952.1 DUF4270 family protein [Bacteroidia bacterium]NNM16309.1 DUF4270 family protein [Bacteroidia bacterium]